MFASGDGEGVGEALFPIIWITMLSYKFYNFQNLDGGFRPHLPLDPRMVITMHIHVTGQNSRHLFNPFLL